MNSISVHGDCGHLDCGVGDNGGHWPGPMVNWEHYECRACATQQHWDCIPIVGDGANMVRMRWEDAANAKG